MKKQTLKLLFVAATASSLLFTNCSTPHVQRLDENSVTDLSGRWNETDSRLTAEEITKEMMDGSWYNTYSAQNKGKKAKIIVGMITNKSHEHIAVETFEKDIEKSIINSGRIGLVQAGGMREEIRAEQADQQNYAKESTIKKFGLENGADFMLQGTINSIVDQYGNQQTTYYQINLELTNIETKEKVWMGDKKIKKYMGNKKMKKDRIM